MADFNAVEQTNKIVDWVRAYFANLDTTKQVVIGMSGGKDSTVTAALLVHALGANRVLGVRMPNYKQEDIDVAREVCDYLGIQCLEFDIGLTYERLIDDIQDQMDAYDLRAESIVFSNAPCRMRTMYLYTISNLIGGRVANTCNLSETYVGYDTKWGDQCGDFNLFQDYTASEVKAIGYVLHLPEKFIEKAPDDGMCGFTDEERWGFTYADLDAYLRGLVIPTDVQVKIDKMHAAAMHKIEAVTLPHPHYAPAGSLNLR